MNNHLIQVGPRTGAAALLAGCCSVPPPSVAVREGFTERAGRHQARRPALDRECAGVRHEFLSSGRNPAIEPDATISDPQAGPRYAGLLDLLARTSLAVSTSSRTPISRHRAFKPWFPSRPCGR